MKTVALFDHLVGGHHFTFIKLFANYLLRAGFRICVFYPGHEEELKIYLRDQGHAVDRIYVHPFHGERKQVKGWGNFNSAVSALRLWRQTRESLKEAQKAHSLKFDFVFFGWLDDYLANYLPHSILNVFFRWRWSGLYFHPWYLFDAQTGTRVSFSSVDSALCSTRCISVGVHDEFLVAKLAQRIGKAVLLFPEIADVTPPRHDDALAMQLKSMAKGRIIVGLIGLAKRKGTLQMISLSKVADPSSFYFFFAGSLPWGDYSEEEFAYLSDFFSKAPEHCYYFPSAIEEGEGINAAIATIDIPFLVYYNFKSSSNFSTKAAHFRKIVLATNAHWIGRTTKKYNLGITVDEGSNQQALEALVKISDHLRKGDWDFSKYDEYLRVHGQEKLLSVFQEALKE